MDEAEKRVSYALTIEAISALFVVLCSTDVDRTVLQNNGFILNNEIKTKLFSFKLP